MKCRGSVGLSGVDVHARNARLQERRCRFRIVALRGLDARAERVTRAASVVTRLPYAGICSEPQGKIATLVGEGVDAGLSRRIQGLLGGVTGCAQLYDLTADLLKLLRA